MSTLQLIQKGFIRAGMLDENGKKPYCQLSTEDYKFIDIKRASNEIALVNNENKTVLYGIDSLLKVIGFSFPWIEKVGNWKPLNYFLRKLYKLISYNRKVIVPSKERKKIYLQCIPDFDFKYRFIYIFIGITISSYIITHYLNFQLNLKFYNFYKIVLINILLLFLNFILLKTFNVKTILNWIGNLQTSILIGSLLILPQIIITTLFKMKVELFQTLIIITIVLTIIDSLRRFKIILYNKKII